MTGQVGPAGEPAPQRLESVEARLLVLQIDDCVALQSTLAAEPFLRLRGSFDGPLEAPSTSGEGPATLHLRLPLRIDGAPAHLDVTVVRPAGHASSGWQLVRARRRRVPPSQQALEVTYARGRDAEIRYVVTMDEAVELLAFQEYSRHESGFGQVPSVAQMVAFMRATLHHRRTTLRSLTSMARGASATNVTRLVAAMNERLSQGQDFTTDGLRALMTWFGERGARPNANSVTALALLSDMALGRLGPDNLDALVDRGEPMPLSAESMVAAAGFLGAWAPLQGIDVFPARLRHADLDTARRALDFLRSTVARRNALGILSDLAADSGSERSRTRVQQLLARVSPQQSLRNDDHVALQEYLTERGRTVHAETVSALAVYVDFEAGILDEEDIDRVTPQRAFRGASLYSLLVVARAFDVELRCWRLSAAADDPAACWRQLENLVRLSEGGVVARFTRPGQAGHETSHLASEADVAAARRRGATPSGEVLADLPALTTVQEKDLTAFESLGQPVIARFVSESGVVQWRRLQRVDVSTRPALRRLLRRPYSFVDRYRVFKYGHAALAREEAVVARALVGRRDVLLVYRDTRGASQYVHRELVEDVASVETAPQQGWTWGRAIVRLADATLFPDHLYEASLDFLLELPDDQASLRRLDLVSAGLESCLTAPWPMQPLVEVEGAYERVREIIASETLRALLVGIFDVSTRDEVTARFERVRKRIWLAEPLIRQLASPIVAKLAVLVMMRALSRSGELDYERATFDDLIFDRMVAAAESGDPEVRRVAVEIMGSEVVASHVDRRLAFSYGLCRVMESGSPTLAAAAARSLAALALDPVRAAPPLASLRAASDQPPACDDLERLADEVMSVYSLPPEHHRAVMTMLAALLPAGDD